MTLHKLELLAPAGKMEVLHRVVAAGADAVYLGGKRFNMRTLNNDFNFTDDEIKYAVDFMHQRNRKIYITINNLYNSHEMEDIANYLLFLRDTGADALIVQDLGIVDLCAKMRLDTPLHASVQMGIANLEAVKLLESQGFQRVILSKNVSLSEIREIAVGSDLGIEYFVHGDLCISHTGQCFMSSFTSGESGNRGKCRKPCRWQYELQGLKEAEYEGYQHFLAHKDLCLYPYLPEMVAAGVSSFKIEGRMRSAEFLASLVSTYRRALDRLIDDPASYQMDENELLSLQEHRIRDYTAGNLIEPLDRKGIGFDGQREPLPPTTAENLTKLELSNFIEEIPLAPPTVPELTVRVGGLDGLHRISGLGVDNIILGYDQIRQNGQYWSLAAINEANDMLKNTSTKIYLETPRIVSQNDLPTIRKIKKVIEAVSINGLVVNDLGSLNLFKDAGLELWSGHSLNTFNRNAAALLQELGVTRVTAALEMTPDVLKMLLNADIPTELMVHGPLPCMVSDFCVIQAAQAEQEGECNHDCLQGEYALVDRSGLKYRIATDYNCRNYLLFPYDLCLYQFLPQMSAWGVKSVRIDGQYYEPEKIAETVTCYREGLEQIKKGQWETLPYYSRLIELFPDGLTAALFTGSRP